MTNQEVLILNDALEQHKEELNKLRGANFAYILNRNVKKLQKEVKDILAIQRITPEFEAYEKKRVAICESFTTKDDQGKPKVIMGATGKAEYDLDVNNPEFKKQMDDLRAENKDVLEGQKKIFEDFNAFLKQENTSLSLLTIDLNMVPSEMSVELMNIVELFIKEA